MPQARWPEWATTNHPGSAGSPADTRPSAAIYPSNPMTDHLATRPQERQYQAQRPGDYIPRKTMIPTPYAQIYARPVIMERYDADALVQINLRMQPHHIDFTALDRLNDVVFQFNDNSLASTPSHGDYVVTTHPIGGSFNRTEAFTVLALEPNLCLAGDGVQINRWDTKMPTEYSYALQQLVFAEEPARILLSEMALIGYTTRPVQVDNYPGGTQLINFYLPVKIWHYFGKS